MNCESCDRPKKSLITALSALGLISFCGVIPSTLMSNKVIRSLTRRSVRARPTRHAAAAEMINVIERAFASPQIDQILNRGDKVFVRQDTLGSIDVNPELLIDFVTADPAKIVFLGIEEESLEQSASVGHGWRIA